jgi:pimeloyl-ACP methyl ester carboxylesterase
VPLSHTRRGSGEPLLLLHGIGCQYQYWDPLMDRLAAERDVVAIDIPGFGDSPALGDGRRPTPAALATAVEGFMDELGWERAHVAGNSLGGWIALELAKRRRALTVGAISPAGFALPREQTFSVRSLALTRRSAELMYETAPRMLASPLARKLAFGQVFARGERVTVDEAVRGIRNVVDSPGWTSTLDALHELHFEGGDRIDVPVTMMWGDRERLLVPRSRQAPRSLRMVPGARLIWLRGCGHTPMWDDPPQVAQAILDASRA